MASGRRWTTKTRPEYLRPNEHLQMKRVFGIVWEIVLAVAFLFSIDYDYDYTWHMTMQTYCIQWVKAENLVSIYSMTSYSILFLNTLLNVVHKTARVQMLTLWISCFPLLFSISLSYDMHGKTGSRINVRMLRSNSIRLETTFSQSYTFHQHMEILHCLQHSEILLCCKARTFKFWFVFFDINGL